MADEYILKSFDGGAQKTSLASSFTVGATTLAVANGSTFPDGSAGPFVVVVDRGLATEEKFLIDTTTGVNGTTFNIQQAGYDGTSTSAHAASALVEHCLDAYTIEQANRYVNLQTTKGDLVSHNGTTTSRLAIGTNNTVLVADSTVAAGSKWATVGNASLADGSVTAGKLASDAVETSKILNLNVTTGKLADGAVTTTKILDAAVTAAKLASDAVIPTGMVSPFAGTTAPSGYVLCDGTAYSRTNPLYSALFALIGTTYGSGDGTFTFNVPNLKGRVPVGLDSSQTEFDTRGETGGAKTHTLVWNEMPQHIHGITDPGHVHQQNVTANADSGGTGTRLDYDADVTGATAYTQGINTQGASTGITINTAGNSQAHNNLQPYMVLNYIVKL
jgi:microcystin-dependent protein